MELHHLRCFVVVADEKHFGRAARRLHLTAAPVSRAVRALEAELGLQLFVRGHHDVRPTPAGEALYAKATEVLRSVDSLSGYARSLRDERPAVTLGAFHLLPPKILDQTVIALHDLTGSNVEVQLIDPSELPQRLKVGSLDFALLNPTPDCTNLPHEPVAVLDYLLVMRADDELAKHDRIDWVDLAQREVTLPPDFPFPSPLNDLHAAFVRHGVTLFDRVDTLDVAAMAGRVRTHRSVIPSLSPQAGGPWRVFDDPAFEVRPFREPPPPYVLSLAWNPAIPQQFGVSIRDVVTVLADSGQSDN